MTTLLFLIADQFYCIPHFWHLHAILYSCQVCDKSSDSLDDMTLCLFPATPRINRKGAANLTSGGWRDQTDQPGLILAPPRTGYLVVLFSVLLHVCICLHVWVYPACGTCRDQRRILGPLKLQLCEQPCVCLEPKPSTTMLNHLSSPVL